MTPSTREPGPFVAGVALSGSARDMGRALAQSLRQLPNWQRLISPLTAYWANSVRRLDPFFGDFGMESLEGANLSSWEARSFAALQLEHLFAVQTRYHFAYHSDAGQLVHGVGLEGPSRPQWQWCDSETGVRSVLVAEPGQLGGLQGMNEHGITVSAAALQNPLHQIQDGRLPAVLVREILSLATCLGDVLAKFREIKPCCPLGILATSVAENRLSYFEWDGKTLATMARPPWLIAGNEPLMQGEAIGRTSPSREPMERLKSQLTRDNAVASPTQIWETLNADCSPTQPVSLWEPGVPRLRHSQREESTTNPIAAHLGQISQRSQPATPESISVSPDSEFPLLKGDAIPPQAEGPRFEVALDPVQDAFLREHRFAGQAVLPGVIMMELVAQASRFGKAPSLSPIHLRNIEFLDRLQFPMEMPRAAEVRLTPGENGRTAELFADFRNAKGKRLLEEKRYFRAEVPADFGEPPTPAPIPRPGHDWFNIWYYDEGLVIYHGEVFRRLQQMQVAGDEAWGKILAPHAADVAPQRGAEGWQLPASVIDACFFICGSFTWFKFPGLVAIPHRIGELTCWSTPQPEEPCLAHVRFREREEKHCHFDITVVGQEGQPLLCMEDYCNRIVSAPPTPS